MVAKIIWSPSALSDLEAITAYIAADNLAAALAIGAQVIETVEQTSAFPRMGKVFRTPGPLEHREMIAGKYRLIYRYDESRSVLLILRIWHGARGKPEIPPFDAS